MIKKTKAGRPSKFGGRVALWKQIGFDPLWFQKITFDECKAIAERAIEKEFKKREKNETR